MVFLTLAGTLTGRAYPEGVLAKVGVSGDVVAYIRTAHVIALEHNLCCNRANARNSPMSVSSCQCFFLEAVSLQGPTLGQQPARQARLRVNRPVDDVMYYKRKDNYHE